MQLAQVPAFSLVLVVLCVSSLCPDVSATDVRKEEARQDSLTADSHRRNTVRATVSGKAQDKLFDERDWRPPAPRMQSSAVATTEVTLPPFQYRYVGRMEAAGKETVHFTKDDRLYSFTTGDTIDGVYRVDSITPQGVQLTYLPTNQMQFVGYSSNAPATAPQTDASAAGGHALSGGERASAIGNAPASATNGAEASAEQASAAAAAVMGISAPAISAMPTSEPTSTGMSVLHPEPDMPLSAPSGAPMVLTPPGGR